VDRDARGGASVIVARAAAGGAVVDARVGGAGDRALGDHGIAADRDANAKVPRARSSA
jgi:hypothetical protein